MAFYVTVHKYQTVLCVLFWFNTLLRHCHILVTLLSRLGLVFLSGKLIFPFNNKMRFVLVNINSCVCAGQCCSCTAAQSQVHSHIAFRLWGGCSSLPVFVLVLLLCSDFPKDTLGRLIGDPMHFSVAGDGCVCVVFSNILTYLFISSFISLAGYDGNTDLSRGIPAIANFHDFHDFFAWIFCDIFFITAHCHNSYLIDRLSSNHRLASCCTSFLCLLDDAKTPSQLPSVLQGYSMHSSDWLLSLGCVSHRVI